MVTGDLIFSSLRSSSKPLPKDRDSSSTHQNDDQSTSISLTRESIHNSDPVNIGSSKNVTIRNNTLTIGVSNQSTGTMFNGPRLQLSTNGLKVQSKLHQTDKNDSLQAKEGLNNEFVEAEPRIKKSCELELAFHESRFSSDQVIVDISFIKGASEGDLAELKTFHRNPTSKDKKIYFIVKDFDSETRRRSKNSQISVLSGQLQQVLGLPIRSKVWIKLKDKKSLAADLIELHVKDCHVNRGDMWKFSSQLFDSCVFLGQKVSLIETLRATVKGIYANGKKVLSGYISERTKIVYRSESAKLLFLIQITDEMWHFEENGEETFHKVVNSLFPKIFNKWKNIGTHHSISIIFCASVDRSETSFYEFNPGERLKNTIDYYRVVVDQVNIVHWVEIMKTLRKEFISIAKDLRNVKLNENISVIKGNLPSVIKSNLLETINFATTLITDPFKQNDLRHTATHAIIISPGSGLYDVDFDLLKITSKKLMTLEITMDLICLTRPPLHIVPLFRYRDYKDKLHYCTPNWLSISFWNDSLRSIDEWHPRCKIYDVHMMGLTETEMKEEIALESLKFNDSVNSVADYMASYDHDVFLAPSNLYSLENFQDSTIHEESSMNLKQKRENTKGSGESSGEVRTHDRVNNNVKNDKSNISENPSFRWLNPKSTDAVLQPTFTEQVFAELSGTPSPTQQSINGEDFKAPLRDSLALNTLKKVTDSNSSVTRRILSRIFPDLSTKNSTDTLRESTENYKQNRLDSSVLSTRESTELNFKPLGISLTDAQKKKTSSNSSVLSSEASINQKQYERRPLLSEISLKSARSNKTIQTKIIGDSWIEIENPSVPVNAELATFLIPSRWKDVFPRYVAKKYTKWRSFTTPAELPLTTSMFPAKDDFERDFSLSNHSVSLNLEQERYQQTVYGLLQNMIYLRLLAGFQFCRGEAVLKAEMNRNKDNDGSFITHLINKDNYTDVSVYMRIDNEIHRIECFDETIDVQRYVKNEDFKLLQSFAKYTPLVKTRYETEYRELDIDPVKCVRESYNWNQLDQVLAGYGDTLMDPTAEKRFRCKFVLLPAEIPPNTFQSTINGRKETLSAEEIRLEGLRKIISSISRSRLRTEEEKQNKKSRKEEIMPEVLFYTGYLFDFIEEQNDFLKNSGTVVKDSIFLEDGDALTKDADIQKISYDLQHGLDPIKLVNRKWHWKRHQNCFIGLELVNWLIEHFSDIHTREEAVSYGQELMNKGLFHHVESRHGFLDGHYFYQLNQEYISDQKPLYKTSTKHSNESHLQRKVSTSNQSESSKSIMHSVSMDSGNASEDFINKSEEHNITVMLSNAVVVDLDPSKKSYTLETCVVHYDRVHNPDHCFHIRLEWLIATPKLIDDLITNWSRLAERYGLKLVEIPWDELCNIPKINPFHSFMNIKLAINPWQDSEFKDDSIFTAQRFFYHIYLLERSGFLLDNRASKFFQTDKSNTYQVVYSWGKPMFKYAQYIHYSGSCMAEIRESGDLFLAPNNLHISRVNIGSIISKSASNPRFTLDAQKIMLNFRKTCESYEDLREIFLEAREKHLDNRDDFDDYSPFQSFDLYT